MLNFQYNQHKCVNTNKEQQIGEEKEEQNNTQHNKIVGKLVFWYCK